MADPTTGPSSPREALLTFRIIGFALGLGVTLFAGVSTFIHLTGRPAAAGEVASIMTTAMIGVAAAAVIGAIIFWRARVAPLIESPSTGDWRTRAMALQTAVIIVWALVEGAAFFAEVVYFLYGDLLAGVLGLVLIWVALGLTWPRSSWLASGRSDL